MRLLFFLISFLMFTSLSAANPCKSNLDFKDNNKFDLKIPGVLFFAEPFLFKCNNGVASKVGSDYCLQSFFCVTSGTACPPSRMQGGVFVLDKSNGGVKDFKPVDLNKNTRNSSNSLHPDFDKQLEENLCGGRAIRTFNSNNLRQVGNRFKCLCSNESCGDKPIISSLYAAAPTEQKSTAEHFDEIVQNGKYADCKKNNYCPISFSPGDLNTGVLYFPVTSDQESRILNIYNNHIQAKKIFETVIETPVYLSKATMLLGSLFAGKSNISSDKKKFVGYDFAITNYLGLSSAEVRQRYGGVKGDLFDNKVDEVFLAGTVNTVGKLLSSVRNTLGCFPTAKNPADYSSSSGSGNSVSPGQRGGGN